MTAPAKTDIAASHRQFVGGSKTAAAIGVSAVITPFRLWEHYTERSPLPDPGGDLRVDLGEPMETVLKPFVERRLNRKLYRDLKEYRHPTLPIVCHLDYRAGLLPGDRKRPVVDMKTSLGWGARHRFGEDGSDEVDPDVLVQMQTYLLCTGADLAYVAALVPGPALKIFTVRADPELHRMIEAGVAEFWGYVQRDEPPPVTTLADAGRRWPVSSGDQTEADADTRSGIALLRSLREQVRALEGSAGALELSIKTAMGARVALVDPEGRPLCTWRSQSRKTLDTTALKAALPDVAERFTKETTSRVFRLGKP